MKNHSFLICLTGLPASGKTTIANKLKIIFEKKFYNLLVEIVDPDIIRQKIMPDKFNPEKEQHVRKMNLNLIERELKKGYIVISDDLNYYSSMRHDLKQIADNLSIPFFIIHVATPLENCLKWNKVRGEPIPDKIIRKINNKFDKFNKYSWDFPIATFNSSDFLEIDLLIQKFMNSLNERLKYLERISKKERKKIDHSNLNIENLDKFSRLYVGELLQDPDLFPFKDRIIKLRRLFVKSNKNKSLKVSEIRKSLNNYLEQNLNIEISDN